jgi:hypothetical protein
MDLTTFEEQLEHLEARYQAWVAPINRAIREKRYLVNRGGYTADDYERDIKRVREEQRAKYDPYRPMYELFDQLGPAYLAASPRERAGIRGAVSIKRGVLSALLGYVYRAADQLRDCGDREWLRRGLAAASIENCSVDYRDLLLALAELYVAAEEVGIKPRSEFKAVSALSSTKRPRGGNTPVSDLLARFHGYGALRERRGRRKPE